MNFLFPSFLYALSALSIPLVIHLFNLRRYRKVVFTNVRLLKEIEVETRSVKKLKSWLGLACRMLATTFLILAFAQPYIESGMAASEKGGAAIIYIDNSFSMNAEDGGISLLAAAREGASAFIRNRQKIVYIFTNEFSHADFTRYGTGEALEVISKINPCHESRSFSEIISRVGSIRAGDDGISELYLYSDFQASQFGGKKEYRDSTGLSCHYIQLLSENAGNISIDSCRIYNSVLAATAVDTIVVHATNYADYAIENQALRLFVNDRQLSLTSMNLAAGESAAISVPVGISDFGLFSCRFETSDAALQEDNNLYFSFRIDSSLLAYHIGSGEANKYFRAVFQPPFEFLHSQGGQVEIDALERTDLFILRAGDAFNDGLLKEIDRRVSSGAGLFIYFDEAGDYETANDLLTFFNAGRFTGIDTLDFEISVVNTNSDLFKKTIEKMPENAAWPRSTARALFSEHGRIISEDILKFADGKCALRKYSHGRGSVFATAFGLSEESSDFTRNALFVPTAINASYSGRKPGPPYYLLSGDIAIDLSHDAEQYEGTLHLTGNNVDFIPEVRRTEGRSRLFLHDQVNESGNYRLMAADQIQDVVSFNYRRRESDPKHYTTDEIDELIANTGLEKADSFSGNSEYMLSSSLLAQKDQALWKYCIILTILFFVAEIMLLKYLKFQ